MDRVKTRFSGVGLALLLVAAVVLAFATAAQAQTPAEDQYGAPTGSSMTGGADSMATTAEGGTGSGGGASAGDSSGETAGILGDVLPSTGGAPIYLALAGTILLGTGATLWLRFRGESR